MNKKGIFSPTLLLILVLVLGYSYYALVINETKDFRFVRKIGGIQSEMIGLYQEAEIMSFYIDQSAKQSAYYAVYALGEGGGFFGEGCGRSKEGYAVWVNKEQAKCYPLELKRDFMSYFKNSLENLFDLYRERKILADSYNLIFMDGFIKGVAKNLLTLTEEKFAEGIGAVGDPANKIRYCNDGKCVAKLAKEYAKLYRGLPYVWGGESPYSYEDTIKDQVGNPNSVFKGVSVSEYQPPGSLMSGSLTTPGFDCSGFVWWVLKHAGLVDVRLGASGYLELARRIDAREICSWDSCDKKTIRKKAKPGDLVFVDPYSCDKEICHMAIYIGNGKIAESIGTRGAVERKIPDNYLPGGNLPIVSIYRLSYGELVVPEEIVEKVEEVYDPPVGYSYVIYSVNNSFEAEVDYDFEDFRIIKEKVDALISLCYNSDCFKSRIDAINEGKLMIDGIEKDDFVWQIRDSDNYVLFDVNTNKKLFYKPIIIKFS